jgi:hypothetical protein
MKQQFYLQLQVIFPIALFKLQIYFQGLSDPTVQYGLMKKVFPFYIFQV